ncbi:hypothetical protein HI914_04839 [Erysiphe necator]|nr:hypothetical protein HI914_04839 [Erysiphe necator]
MSLTVLPAYSLRVQLFSSAACGATDKPVRNFRVVTSPENTIREFCQEASRIHEINYGHPLVIKKVQDDQSFDVTQSEILGNLFSTSSIIRVVQASKHPGIRDSIPPTSALRFNPNKAQKRRRYPDTIVSDTENLWKSIKRQKLNVIDPDCPLPSRESDGASSSNHLSHAQIIGALKKSELAKKPNHKNSNCQISETPEPVATGWQNFRALEARSIETQIHSKPDFDEQQNRYRQRTNGGLYLVEPDRTSPKIPSQQVRKVHNKGSSVSSARSSISLGQSYIKDDFVLSSKFSKAPIPLEARDNVELDSAECRLKKRRKKKKCFGEDQRTQVINRSIPGTHKYDKNQLKTVLAPKKFNERLDTKISHEANSPNITQNISRLQDEHISKIKSGDLECSPHAGKAEHHINLKEKSFSSAEISKEVQDVQNKQKKKKKRKKKKEATLKNESQSNYLVGDTYNGQGKKSNRGLEASEQNFDLPVTISEKIQPIENKLIENHIISNTILNCENIHQKPEVSTEKSNVTTNSNSNSPSAQNQTARILKYSPITLPHLERKQDSPIKTLHDENSSPSKTSNKKRKTSHDHFGHAMPSSDKKLPVNEEENKYMSSTFSEKFLPNTDTLSQPESTSSKPSKTTQFKSRLPNNANISFQKKSFTPILPPPKNIDLFNIPVARDDKKILVTGTNAASATKIIPLKITPIVPNKRYQLPKSNLSKPNLPITTSSLTESKSTELSSKVQGQNQINPEEENKLFGKKDRDTLASTNHNVEILLNKENKQGAYSNSISNNLKEPNITEDDKVVNDESSQGETHSQNSSDRDSRSPVEFHQNFQPKNSHQTSSLSSSTHSEDENSEIDQISSSALDDSDNLEITEAGNTPDNKEKALDDSNITIRPRVSSDNKLDFEHQKFRPSSSHSMFKIQVPNSSPALQRTTLSNHLTSTNMSESSLKESNDNTSNSFISGSAVVPSSLEMKKPQFKFGASLSELHRNGGLINLSQTNHRSNEQNLLAMSLATETLSESESEESDTSLSS